MEIFSSVQGEGPWVGAPTLFVRTGGCDLRCGWCDSPNTWRPAADCRIEVAAGEARFASRENPLAPSEVALALEKLGLARHRFVSLTGGEPLLQPAPVIALAEMLRARGASVYLESHGLEAEAMAAAAAYVDVVSMDWKLASDVRREDDPKQGEVEAFHDAHTRFLEAAQGAGECFVKIVVTPNTQAHELDEACRRIAASAPETLLVLQPVTPTGRVHGVPPAEQLLAWTRQCGERLADVRLIPQTHPGLGAL